MPVIFANIAEYRRKTGSTVVIVSHSMEDMARYCDRIAVMSGGKLIMNGTRDEIFSSSSKLEEAGLDIPQITKLALLLKERGIDISEAVYTIDGAFDALVNK